VVAQLHGIEEAPLHGLGQAERMESAADADALVMHPLGRFKDALVTGLQDLGPEHRG
jgi:hypothetical protein